jgi:antirestriction protein
LLVFDDVKNLPRIHLAEFANGIDRVARWKRAEQDA